MFLFFKICSKYSKMLKLKRKMLKLKRKDYMEVIHEKIGVFLETTESPLNPMMPAKGSGNPKAAKTVDSRELVLLSLFLVSSEAVGSPLWPNA